MKRIDGRLLFVFVFVISSWRECEGNPIEGVKKGCEVRLYDLTEPTTMTGPEIGRTEFDYVLGSPYMLMHTDYYSHRYYDKVLMECYNIEGDFPDFKGEIILERKQISGIYMPIMPFPYGSPFILICHDCKFPKLTANITANLSAQYKFTFLDFGASQIAEIDTEALDSFTVLSALDLDDNYLKSIPDSIFVNTKPDNTFQLSLRNNSFDKISKAFCNLEEFEFINLQNNKIESMEIDCKLKVKSMNLSGNLIGSLSLDWLKNYEGMDILDLSFNNLVQLKDVEKSSLGLHLNCLILSNNHLRNIGRRSFRRFATLQSLRLNKNDITSIDSEAFKGLKVLLNLDMSHNLIASIPFGVFNDLATLKELNLANNKLTQLSMQTFAGLTELKYLNLSANCLRQIASTDLLQIKQLQAIDLSSNRLQKLDAKAILNQHAVIWMGIKNNFWNCRQLVEILQLVKEKGCIVKRGDLFGVANIHGIACSAKDIATVDQMDFAGFLDTLSDEIEMELILSKLDSLPVDDESSALEILVGKIKSLVLLIAVLFVVDFVFQWLFRLYQARHTMTIPITNLK